MEGVWYDGCNAVCRCENAKVGYYRCQERSVTGGGDLGVEGSGTTGVTPCVGVRIQGRILQMSGKVSYRGGGGM